MAQADLVNLAWSLGLLIGLLLALAVAIALAKTWYNRMRNPYLDDELLSDFRELQNRGELSPEEFKKIKAMLNKARSVPRGSPPKPTD